MTMRRGGAGFDEADRHHEGGDGEDERGPEDQ
jgi:hypothetical protein